MPSATSHGSAARALRSISKARVPRGGREEEGEGDGEREAAPTGGGKAKAAATPVRGGGEAPELPGGGGEHGDDESAGGETGNRRGSEDGREGGERGDDVEPACRDGGGAGPTEAAEEFEQQGGVGDLEGQGEAGNEEGRGIGGVFQEGRAHGLAKGGAEAETDEPAHGVAAEHLRHTRPRCDHPAETTEEDEVVFGEGMHAGGGKAGGILRDCRRAGIGGRPRDGRRGVAYGGSFTPEAGCFHGGHGGRTRRPGQFAR